MSADPPGYQASEPGLVPQELDYEAVPPFLGLTLGSLAVLGQQDSVRQYAQANPEAHRAILALATAVAAAGTRVRDTARSADPPRSTCISSRLRSSGCATWPSTCSPCSPPGAA